MMITVKLYQCMMYILFFLNETDNTNKGFFYAMWNKADNDIYCI